jgi:O-antigen/teichoic acid export membrane protein
MSGAVAVRRVGLGAALGAAAVVVAYLGLVLGMTGVALLGWYGSRLRRRWSAPRRLTPVW